MDHGSSSQSNPPIDKSKVYDIMPLKSLAPIFPNPPGSSFFSTPQNSPFMCIPPTGPFPSGAQPFYPFLVPNDSQNGSTRPGHNPGSSIPAPTPLNSFKTPISQPNGSTSRSTRAQKAHESKSNGPGENPFVSGFTIHVANATDQTTSAKRKGRATKEKERSDSVEPFDLESLVNSYLSSFGLNHFNDLKRTNGDRDTTQTILLVYELLRRKLAQIEESKAVKRPDLKASNLLMSKGIRTNNTKRIGQVAGVEVGDIFFFRMELCMVGLHTPTMAGIDYMTVKVANGDDYPVAVSIVSSGGYDDEGDDGDVLIYSGHGGVQRRDGQMFDQKLEKGNLALEKSLHRGNDVRVIRGIKDISGSTGKTYVYDGLYRIQESWAEKNHSGCNVFKYKMVRVPGQNEVFSLWKSIRQWKEGGVNRAGLIRPDLDLGSEVQPVSLFNDVDGERGPANFTYVSSLNGSRPFSGPGTSTSPGGCSCKNGCQSGDATCPCVAKNGGFLPYTSIGSLLTDKSLIHECGEICACPPTCRNRISGSGLKARLEVFKTRNRGWGVRSWDPIRAGGFICEYAGDVINTAPKENDNYIFDATRIYEPLEPNSSGSNKAPFPLAISAKNNGNVARFMNHGCSPNVFWLPVLRESGSGSIMHVAFFAIRHIPPMQEITYDYGMVSPERREKGKKRCLCGSSKCRGFFY